MTTIADLSNVNIAFFTFYMLMFANYSGQLIGCKLQNKLNNSILAKHAVGILMMLFFVVIVTTNWSQQGIGKMLLLTIALYIWFLVTTRCHTWTVIIVLCTVLAAYMISNYVENNKDKMSEETKKSYKKLVNILTFLSVAITIFGFGLYLVEKRYEYSENFSWYQFIVGDVKCKNKSPTLSNALAARKRGGRAKKLK